MDSDAVPQGSPRAGAVEVFKTFLKLGLTSFGGPIAHLGYFHRELVVRRAWVDDQQYGELLALSQFLPGPSSSQLGFALGLIRAGWRGALAAAVAFTLPSALLLILFAAVADALSGAYGQSVIHGLKLVALAVVADGVRRMARQLTPDVPRLLLAAGVAAFVLLLNRPWAQLVAILGSGLLGHWVGRHAPPIGGASFALRYGPGVGLVLLSLFVALLLLALAPSEAHDSLLTTAAAGFYRAGALVFGGGHVVLPLLEHAVVTPGLVGIEDFLAGYGAAQAVPGPMFTLAAYLGARLDAGAGGWLGAAVCLVAILLPGFLLMAGTLPLWRTVGRHPRAARTLAGVNAGVVGLLAAALYQPLWTGAVERSSDVLIAMIGFVLLSTGRAGALTVVAWCVGASSLLAAL